jgi:hydroxymethylglutaryl-CoA lyase
VNWVFPKLVRIREDGPRDGFQNETQFIPTDKKIAMINALLETGLPRIEVTSFVHPKWIPQLVDAEEVLHRIDKNPAVDYAVLVPNQRGLERAIEVRKAGAKIDDIALVMSVTESHNRANLNRSVAQSLAEIGDLIRTAKEAGFRVGSGLAVSLGCPFEGHVDPEKVIEIAKEMHRHGADEIVIADTIGVANPVAVRDLFARARQSLPGVEITAHFHNTRGQGLANVVAAMLEGIDSFETAFGELGGCPYAPGATGNISTEDLVSMLHGMGIETGVDLVKLIACARTAQEVIGRELPSHVLRAGPVNWEGEGQA